jgi:peptidoglycan-associated lipoprotein
MQMKLRLAIVCLAGGLWLAGCATGTSTQPPVEDKSATPGSTGQPVPESTAPRGEALPGAAEAELLAKRRVHFAFDSSQLDDENRKIVEAHARHLVATPNLKVHLEGHTDERGTREYNMALGERRAQTVQKTLQVLGVASNRITIVSYGEEKPLATGHDESAWAQNRRVEIIYR